MPGEPPVRPRFSVHSRTKSFVYAFRGLGYLITSEHNAWIHALATIAVVIAGFAFDISRYEWLWVVGAIGAVWLGEAFNTAIERLADIVTLERDPRIAVVKDTAAAGVLVAAIGAAIVGVLVFLPKII